MDCRGRRFAFPTFSPPRARPYAGEEQLAGYLDRAREILGGACPDLDQGPSGLPADFEELREFHLPPACVASEPALVGAPV